VPPEQAREEIATAPRTTSTSEIESAIANQREVLTAAFAEERAEFQMRSMQERTAIESSAKKDRALLEAALIEERNAHQKALEDLVQARIAASARAGELADLSREVAELRTQVARSLTIVGEAQRSVEGLKEFETNFARERESHRETQEALEAA